MRAFRFATLLTLASTVLVAFASPVSAYPDACTAGGIDAGDTYATAGALAPGLMATWCSNAVGNAGLDPGDVYTSPTIGSTVVTSYTRLAICATAGDVLALAWFREATYTLPTPPGIFKGALAAGPSYATCGSLGANAGPVSGETAPGGEWVYTVQPLNSDTAYNMLWWATL